MNYVEIINDYENEVNELETLKKFIKHCTKELNLKNVMFNVIIINDEKIHKLNKEYRQIDRPTDVITFALEDDKKLTLPSVRVLGDVYISYDRVIKQSKEYGHGKTRELCFLAVHGLLHLLGYDHLKEDEEKIMFSKQKELLDSYGIKK